MKGWRNVTLSDISVAIDYGYTASSSNINIGPKFLRITDIATSNIIDWNSVPFCSISQEDNEKYKLYSGDIVIARTGASTGATYTIKDTDPKDLVFASYLIRYRINPEIADAKLVGKFLRSKNWNEYVSGVVGGSAQPGANAKVLGAYSFLLPPLTEQRAIAAVLSSLDDKIDLLYRQNATLEAMAEALFRQWFVVEAKEEWEDGVLGDILQLMYGKNLRESDRNGTGYPVVGSNGIVGYHGNFLVDRPGIVIGRKGTLGKVILLNKPFYPIDTTYYVKSIYDFDALFFLYFLLKSINFEELNTDSAVPGLNRNIAHAIEIKKAPVNIIRKFEHHVSPLFKKINHLFPSF